MWSLAHLLASGKIVGPVSTEFGAGWYLEYPDGTEYEVVFPDSTPEELMIDAIAVARRNESKHVRKVPR